MVHSQQDASERAITEHTATWSDREAAEAKDAVLDTTATPGWQVIREQVAAEKASLREQLDSLADRDGFEHRGRVLAGEVRGLERLTDLVDGVILRGEEAERDA